MAYCVALLCCVNKLGGGSVIYDDSTSVLADYGKVRDLFKSTLHQTTTDEFWDTGMGTNASDFNRALKQFLIWLGILSP